MHKVNPQQVLFELREMTERLREAPHGPSGMGGW
jgi:hypothetical protein